jgi:hypothetical protein
LLIPLKHSARADTILNTGRMDDHGEDKAHRIYGDVLLAPLGFLAAS